MQVHFPPIQVSGMPPMPQMSMPPMPPGMGMVPPMGMMSGGPPPPGIHMSMDPQHRAAMALQEEMAIQQVRAVGGLPEL